MSLIGPKCLPECPFFGWAAQARFFARDESVGRLYTPRLFLLQRDPSSANEIPASANARRRQIVAQLDDPHRSRKYESNTVITDLLVVKHRLLKDIVAGQLGANRQPGPDEEIEQSLGNLPRAEPEISRGPGGG